ncbi:hypothetical protein ACHAWX_005514 [Stephanocyclus meneghinianus]
MKTQPQRAIHLSILIVALATLLRGSVAFAPAAKNIARINHRSGASLAFPSSTALHMSDSGGGGGGGAAMQRDNSAKTGSSVITKDRESTDTQMEEDVFHEEQWRVILHNDEVHTFNYVISSLIKVIGTIDKKKAHDICVVTHGQGQATVAQGCYKPQAMKYCIGLQRAGLTASIAPEGKFEGSEPQAG